MATIDTEIAAFTRMQHELEAHHMGKWVLIRDEELVGAYNTIEEAAEIAVKRFGRGPYLIRKVGAPPITLPASVMFRPVYA